jgi:hypothetical protein
MRQQSGTFKAYGADGQEYTIVVFTQVVHEATGSSARPEEGVRRMQTSDRRTVNWLKKGKYRIRDRHQDIVVTSNDPNAI